MIGWFEKVKDEREQAASTIASLQAQLAQAKQQQDSGATAAR
jgi:hypothetical protein